MTQFVKCNFIGLVIDMLLDNLTSSNNLLDDCFLSVLR